MKNLVFFLVVVAVAVFGLGLYLGWFSVLTTGDSHTSHVTLSVDKEKVKQDEVAAKRELEQAGAQVRQKVSNLTDKVKKGSPAPTEHAAEQEKLEAKWKELDRKIDDLKRKLPAAGTQVSDKLKMEYDELVKEKDACRKKFDDLKEAGEQKWQKVKIETDEALDHLHKTFERVASHVR